MIKIRLIWDEVNYGEEEHRVYRSTSPMDPESLPAPIATLGPNQSMYEDSGLTEGETYFYRVSAINQGEEYLSDEFEILAESGGFDILFSGGESGFWFDFSKALTFQDFSETTSVASDGDPIRVLVDRGPNGERATLHDGAATPPVFRDSGLVPPGEGMSTFNGTGLLRVDPELFQEIGSCTVMVVSRFREDIGEFSPYLFSTSFGTGGTATFFGFGYRTNLSEAFIRTRRVNSNSLTTTDYNHGINPTEVNFVEAYFDWVNQEMGLIINGTDFRGSTGQASGLAGTGNSFADIAGVTAGGTLQASFGGEIREIVMVDRLLTTEEREVVQAFIAAKYGIPFS